MAAHCNVVGAYDGAIASGQRLLALAATPEDLALRVGAHQHLGAAYLSLGDHRQAMVFLRRNVTRLAGDLLYEPFGRLALPSVTSRAWLLWCLTELGEFVEAITTGEEGVRIAEAVNHPFSLINAYSAVGYMYFRQGALDKARAVLERSLALCQATDFRNLFSATAATLGHAYALSGRLTEALPLLEQAVEHSTSRNTLFRQALWIVWLSEAYLLAGRWHDARPMAQRALEQSRERQEQGHQAYALQLLGDIARYSNPPHVEPAEAHYQQALALANELGMRPLQAHCHRGLGMVYRQIGQMEQARAALSTAMAMYRDMAMAFWLPETEAALAEAEGTS
jgi:tetratricopeptide (TPR) repeat protein